MNVQDKLSNSCPPDSYFRLETSFDEEIRIASLTNQQLVREVLIAAKKIAKAHASSHGQHHHGEAYKWILTDGGTRIFLRVCKSASTGDLLPIEWESAFSLVATRDKDHDGVQEKSENSRSVLKRLSPMRKCANFGELLKMALKELSPNSHIERLSRVLEAIPWESMGKMNPSNAHDKPYLRPSLSVRQAAALLNASTKMNTDTMDEIGGLVQHSSSEGYANSIHVQYQAKTMSLLQKTLHRSSTIDVSASTEIHGTLCNALNILASVQIPVLQNVNMHILETFILSKQLHKTLRQLFVPYNVNEEGQTDPASEIYQNLVNESDTSADSNGENLCLRMRRFVEAADLARRGDQLGSKHGCVICINRDIITDNKKLMESMKKNYFTERCHDDARPNNTLSSDYDIIVGRGWNHNAFESNQGRGFGRKRMIHAEVHAVADTCRIFGETLAFEEIFPHANILIVELDRNGITYDDAPPCPKCEQMLRGVGLVQACHSTNAGILQDLQLPPSHPKFLTKDVVKIPLRVACDEMGIDCIQLRQAGEQ